MYTANAGHGMGLVLAILTYLSLICTAPDEHSA
jgi:hypothetical protein